MDFDRLTDWRGTGNAKWDAMQAYCGVSADDGLAMWTADMDFAAPDFLTDAVRQLADGAHFGYFTGIGTLSGAIAWWMQKRHGWQVDPDWMFHTVSIGNAISSAIHALSEPGDHVAIFSPVYHEFAQKIVRAGRNVTHLPLPIGADGMFQMDLDAAEACLTGREKLLLLCSPHNPAGRIWTQGELQALAAFCQRHDLILASDEIHHDLIMPGGQHMPTHLAAPEIEDRLIVMTSASKTFSIAGSRLGCVMIPDPDLRARFAGFFNSLDIRPNRLGYELTRAAYSPAGAAWVDALMPYLDANRQFFCDAMNALPGITAMPMQATYLAWLDFAGTGMAMEEVRERVYGRARIGATWGPTLGPGGETCLRVNIATHRTRVEDAAARIQAAFADLQ